jgi:hypothetical protein
LASERGFPEGNDGEEMETGGVNLPGGGVMEKPGKGKEERDDRRKRKLQGTGQEER